MQVEIIVASTLATLVLGNIATIIGAFVSMRVAIGKVEKAVEELEKDVNNLASMIRSMKGN